MVTKSSIRGFTLIELLIIIAIIALLIGILVPALAAARRAVRGNQQPQPQQAIPVERDSAPANR